MKRTSCMSLTAICLFAACSREVVLFKPDRAGSNGGVNTDAGDVRDASSEDSAAEPLPEGGVMSPARALGLGLNHGCTVQAGALYCWGGNGQAELGLGHTKAVMQATRVGTGADWRDVCGGEEHTCALRDDGSVWCWGKNLHGELGVGDKDRRLLPTRVADSNFVRIACGGYNTCGIRADGALFCWGDNWEGKLGLGDPFGTPDGTKPSAVSGALSFRELSLGQGNVAGVTREGTLYCWGRNTDGQCGTMSDVGQLRSPTRVGADSDYAHVSTGMRQTCAIKVDGRLFCWGTDSGGSLGLGVANDTLKSTPLQVGARSDWTEVHVLWFHTCARRGAGALYCWGRNAEGQLGLGDIEPRNVPERVGSAEDWQELAIGRFFSCGLRPSGLYCWGVNDEWYELGLSDLERRYEPTLVPLP